MKSFAFAYALFFLRTAFGTDGVPGDGILHFELTTSSCESGSFPNLINSQDFLSLKRDVENTRCSLGMGIESLPRNGNHMGLFLSADRTNVGFLDHFQHGITLELWFKPLQDSQNAEYRPILTIGTNETVPAVATSTCDTQKFDFQLGQQGDGLELTFRTSDIYFEPCQHARLDDVLLSQNQMAHVAIAFGLNSQRVYVNGETKLELQAPFTPDLRHWREDYLFHFFSHMQRDAWPGRIYQFDVYDRPLSHEEILARLAKGMPHSLPFAFSHSVSLNEDAELVPGSQEPEWYSASPDVLDPNVQIITLPVVSVDREVASLLAFIGLDPEPVPPLYIYVTNIPIRGDLYQLDGTLIGTQANTPAAVRVLHNESVVYIPPFNEHSAATEVFASFQYCATNHPIFDPVQCQSANVEISVAPVNDPPVAVARPSSPVNVLEGITEPLDSVIELSGTDVDESDWRGIIEITSPPQSGQLSLSVSAFREDGLLHGVQLEDINFTVPGPAYVQYTYTGEGDIVQGLSVTDSFRFRVSDEQGQWSAEQVVDIHVLSALEAIPQQDVALEANTNGRVILRGYDWSGFQRQIGYFVESVGIGEMRLVDPVSNGTLQAGMVLAQTESFPYEEGVKVELSATMDVCNAAMPSLSSPSFSFRVVAFENGEIVSASPVATQHWHVQCPRFDDFAVEVPSGPYTSTASGWLVDHGSCNGDSFDPIETSVEACEAAAVIEGISVDGPTRGHADPIRVSVTAQRGHMTLNRNFWSDLSLLNGREAVSAHIEFLALPNNLNDILSYLFYQGHTAGEDLIQITFQLGKCTDDEEDSTGVECRIVQKSIPVKVVESDKKESGSRIHQLPWYIPVYLLFFCIFVKVKRRGLALFCCQREDDEDESCTASTDIEQNEVCRWVQHVDPNSGDFFYEDVFAGIVTWEPPVDEDFISAPES